MIIDRRADRPSSDCREAKPGSGAELQHATLRAVIEATMRSAGPTLGNLTVPRSLLAIVDEVIGKAVLLRCKSPLLAGTKRPCSPRSTMSAMGGQRSSSDRASGPQMDYFDRGKSSSDTKTIRSFSAFMIFFVGNVLPLRTLLTTMRLSPLLLAHAAWPPARFTSERSKRTTSSASKMCICSRPKL